MLALGACAATRPQPRPLAASRAVPPRTIPPSIDVCVAPAGRSFAGQSLVDANFHAYPAGSLRGANFDGADLRGATFAGQDLTGASFQGAKIGQSDKGPADFSRTTLHRTCFRGAVMNDAQFDFAHIRCADFSKTSLMNATFGPRQSIDEAADCRTRFVEATLDVHTIGAEHWRAIDFTRADFKNFAPSNFSLAGRDLTGAMLAQTVLPGVDLSAANLTGADLTQTNLVNANLSDATLNGAKLVNVKLRGAQLRCARAFGSKGSTSENPNGACQANPDSSLPTAAADFTNAELAGADLSYATFNSGQFRGAVLDRVTATKTSFLGASFLADGVYPSTSFEAADLSGAYFARAHLDEVSFTGDILTGADFSSTTLHGTSFENAILPNAVFTNTSLEAVTFRSAILESAKFNDAVLQTGPVGSREVIFTCAQLGGADFSGADVKQARFVSAVMPAAGDCCSGVDTPYCGTIDITHVAYGATIPPTIAAGNHGVLCPDESTSPCATWQLPGWQTDRCNANAFDHTMRLVWSKPADCTAPPADVLHFADENLAACIRDAIPSHPPQIPRQLAAQLTQLQCAGRNIADLTGLEALTGLVNLDLDGNRLTQFTLTLPRLRSLKLSGNRLTTLNVGAMPDLVRLDASANQLTAAGIDSSVNLVVLDLSQNRLTSFDLALPNPRLSYADLSSNQLTNVLDPYNPDLGGAPQLAHVDVSNNQLTTFGPVNRNAALASLRVSCNPSFDCAKLGLDGTSPLMQSSGCAAFNSQSNTWSVRAHPDCP